MLDGEGVEEGFRGQAGRRNRAHVDVGRGLRGEGAGAAWDEQRRETAVEKLRAGGADAFGVPLDVTDDARAPAAAGLIADRAGGLDFLVTNTGITSPFPQTPSTPLFASVTSAIVCSLVPPILVRTRPVRPRPMRWPAIPQGYRLWRIP
ncbi:SDR family NAD(P)-dependent oxidoreductase [Amycolatopsis australiensis]|uniref:SDR family NAD(P)-dependent oxidoreductase n=1 Tax=Amycolatopsis australiensis TaxID=546364 RepID=UPI001FE81798|nr:SDR family NAD(P)-dependent oxidoreductase [Amycolatopsis australiensis]